MSRDISKATELLQEFWPLFKAKYEAANPSTELFLTHVDRTPVEQLTLFVQGRLPQFKGPIVTWKDGFINKSKHNEIPAEAIDVAVRVGGVVSWDIQWVMKIGALIKDMGWDSKVKWGGVFGDNYHIEAK